MVCNTANHNKPFLNNESVKKCTVHVAESVCPQNKIAFKNINLSRTTTVHHVQGMNIHLLTQLSGTVHKSAYFSVPKLNY